jgi:hypothetical protein
MLYDIPSPPAVPTQYLLAGGAAAVVLGLGLVLAGRWLGRLVVALAAAGAAVASVPLFIDLLPYREYVPVAIGAAVVGLILGLLLSRVAWAAMLGATVGLVALWAMIERNAGAATSRPAEWANYDVSTFGNWLWAVTDYHFRWFVSLWPQYNVTLALWVLLPSLAFMVAALVLPAGAMILMSSLLGAAAVAGGVLAMLSVMRPEWLAACWAHFSTVLTAAGALALVGLIAQVWAEVAAHAREEEKEEKEKAEKEKSDKPEKADKPAKTDKPDKAKESAAKKD